MYVMGDCKKLMMVRANTTIIIVPKKSAARGRESSFFPVCQLRTKRNENINCQNVIDYDNFLYSVPVAAKIQIPNINIISGC